MANAFAVWGERQRAAVTCCPGECLLQASFLNSTPGPVIYSLFGAAKPIKGLKKTPTKSRPRVKFGFNIGTQRLCR